MSRWSPVLLSSALALANVAAKADDLPGVADADRARSNYMLNCEGCHGHDGMGNAAAQVPRMKGFVGNFLRVPGGREFVVQVPGSANAALDDAELAELLNWLLPTISAAELPSTYEPYSAREVSRLRKTPEIDVVGRRTRLLRAMQREGLIPD